MSTLLSGYGYRLVARLGLAADIPPLAIGEIGYDIDMKVFRVGDDTASPPRIPTSKSLGDFDMSSSGAWTFNTILLANNGTIDGVDPSKLNTSNGFLVRKGNNDFHSVSLVSGDSSITITGGDGVTGNVDLRISQSILDMINNGGYLQSVATSTIMTGDGRVTSPLSVKASSITQVGVTRFATALELGAGIDNVAVTPAALASLDGGSALATYLRQLFQVSFVLTTDGTISGEGNIGSPLSVIQATTSQRGAVELATQVEVNNGTNAVAAITPATFKGLVANSPTALALKEALGIGSTFTLEAIRMTGPGVIGRGDNAASQPPQVIPFATRAKVINGNVGNDNDVVNQAAMKEFFPSGLVKIDPKPTGSLPAPATVGKGTIAYDDSLQRIKVSNGTQWMGLGNFIEHPRYSMVSQVKYPEGGSTYTISRTEYDEYGIWHSNVPNGTVGYTMGFQGSSDWVNITSADSSGLFIYMGGNLYELTTTFTGPLAGIPQNLITPSGYDARIRTLRVTGWTGAIRSNQLNQFFVTRWSRVADL